MIPGRRFKLSNWGHSFVMAKYPSVAFSALYYFLSWTFINTMPAVTIAATYSRTYGWQSGRIGLCLGLSLMIGSFLAEPVTGRVTDLIMYLDAKKNNGVRRPEARLYQTIVAAVLQPVGLIIYGFTIQYKKGWVASSAGLSISMSLRNQSSTSIKTLTAYCRRFRASDGDYLPLRLCFRLL